MEWWQALRGRPFYWVLDGSDPAASYYMLRYVVERPDRSRARQAARLELMQWDAVAQVKSRLQETEIPGWDRAYAGPLWALRLLAEWGHPGDDEAIATALDWALDRDAAAAHPYGKELMLHIGAAFGFASDERVRALMSAVVEGLSSPAVKPERVALAAMAFAAIPPEDLDSGTVAPVER